MAEKIDKKLPTRENQMAIMRGFFLLAAYVAVTPVSTNDRTSMRNYRTTLSKIILASPTLSTMTECRRGDFSSAGTPVPYS